MNRNPAQAYLPAASFLVAKLMSPSFFWIHLPDSKPIKVVPSFSQQLEAVCVLIIRREHVHPSIRETLSKCPGFSYHALQCL